MNPLKSFVIVSFMITLAILLVANHNTNTSILLLGVMAAVTIQLAFKNRDCLEMIDELRLLSQQIKQLNSSITAISKHAKNQEPPI